MNKIIARWFGLVCLTIVLLTVTACAKQPSGEVPLIDTGVDPNAWAAIPAGPVLIGQHDHSMTLDSGIEMMITPVTNAQYAVYLNDAIAKGTVRIEADRVWGYYAGDPYHAAHHEVEIAEGDWVYADVNATASRLLWDGSTFDVVAGYENHPATMVTWFGANGYCEYYSWRLPTDLEWEKAARGENNRPYPWGDEITIAHANSVSSQDAFERLSESGESTTPVGLYNGNTYAGFTTVDAASPYGLYDMAGNVWQWTADVQKGAHYRSLRGGSYMTYAYNLRVWTMNNATPTHSAPDVGFRCARD